MFHRVSAQRAEFSHSMATFSRQRWAAAPKDFWPKVSVFHFTCPEDTFLFGGFSVLPVDFLVTFSRARILSSSSSGNDEERNFGRRSPSAIFACPEVIVLIGGFSVLPVDFLGDFFRGSNLVVKFFGNVRRNGTWPKISIFHFTCPEDTFSSGGFVVLPVDFLCDFFKGSNLVDQFFGNVRRNNFRAELNVSHSGHTRVVSTFQTEEDLWFNA